MATLKDVARRAGVGLSTASRAISGKGPVSAEAAARVHAAIAELNFRPSSIGRAMATRSLGIIGLFVPTFFVVVQRFENWLAERKGNKVGVQTVGSAPDGGH